MKVAFVGAQGSGKTTLSALFIRFLASQGLPVVAIDAGAGQRLAGALGATDRPPALTAHLTEIKEYVRGTNPRIASAEAMVETTPPGRGSWLLRLGGADPVHKLAVGTPCGARVLATGPGTVGGPVTSGVGLYLNHLVDGPGEYLVADCADGTEWAGLFDLIFIVTRPTDAGATGVNATGPRATSLGAISTDASGVGASSANASSCRASSCGTSTTGASTTSASGAGANLGASSPGATTARATTAGASSTDASGVRASSANASSCGATSLGATGAGATAYGRWSSCGAAIALVGNAVSTRDEVALLREHTGADPLTWFTDSPDAPATAALEALRAAVDAREKDWPAISRGAARRHAAYARANRAATMSLLAQIDPGFTMPAPQSSLAR